MAKKPIKAFLLAAGGTIVAVGIAYVSGAFDPYFQQQPAVIAKVPVPGVVALAEQKSAENLTHKPAAEAPEPIAQHPAAATFVVAPTFDVVRVEGNGSVVIAGKATGKAKVEIVTGSQVIGTAVAGTDGDFAVVLDKPLKPGYYQIVLRSTAPDSVVATSTETTVVSVPEHPGGQVLALVEEPGKPSQLITVSEPAKSLTSATTEQMVNAPTVTSAAMVAEQPAQGSFNTLAQEKISVWTVEIGGTKILITGAADAERKVRAYANESLIGEAVTTPEGRFLIKAERDLPVGDYIVRVDALEADGVKIVARAAVPFTREPSEAITAVATTQSETVKSTKHGTASPVPVASTETSITLADHPAKIAATTVTQTQPTHGQADAAMPKLQSVNSSVIIRRGDSLWGISRRVYGYGVRYSSIYLANQDQIHDPDRIWPGQVFRVPEKSHEGEAANMDAIVERVEPNPKPEAVR